MMAPPKTHDDGFQSLGGCREIHKNTTVRLNLLTWLLAAILAGTGVNIGVNVVAYQMASNNTVKIQGIDKIASQTQESVERNISRMQEDLREIRVTQTAMLRNESEP